MSSPWGGKVFGTVTGLERPLAVRCDHLAGVIRDMDPAAQKPNKLKGSIARAADSVSKGRVGGDRDEAHPGLADLLVVRKAEHRANHRAYLGTHDRLLQSVETVEPHHADTPTVEKLMLPIRDRQHKLPGVSLSQRKSHRAVMSVVGRPGPAPSWSSMRTRLARLRADRMASRSLAFET